MCVLLALGACALGTVAKAGHRRCLPQLTCELSRDTADGGFFSAQSLRLRVCMLICHAMCILVVALPFDSLAC